MTDLVERLRDGLSSLDCPCTCATDEIGCPYCNAAEKIERRMKWAADEIERLHGCQREFLKTYERGIFEDMRAWILERHQPGKNSFEMASLRSFVDAYEKDRNID